MKSMYLRAATLNEILIVMVLMGIISCIAFEGLSLYERMYRYAMLNNQQSANIYENYIRIQNLFCNADSICKGDGCMHIYKKNDCVGILKVNDSIMTFKSQNSFIIDTLYSNISEYEVRICDNGSGRYIDSLLIINDNVLIKFGVCIHPEQSALSELVLIEKKCDTYEN